jgi:beta-galactosidase GanA
MPHLRRQGAVTQLIVGGQPFLVLGGALGNSTASSPEALEAAWPRLTALGLNTALVPATWELCEPAEGRFDFALVDRAIDGARRHGLRLVLLWFGTWKNSMSCYAPAWVKTDQARFPRAELGDGRGTEMLSAFSAENLRADARAFAALMRHVREVDARQQTVIMVQVENEAGMLEEAADRSQAARRAFAAGGPWAEARAGEPDEIFMAWHLGLYVNGVAAAGKAEYPLPMFVNAALNRPGRAPGEYPSGGPLPHLADIWRSAAPSIDLLAPDLLAPDLLAPDISFPDFAAWCAAYAHPGNPLFVPEVAAGPSNGVEALYAFGRHDAIGFSPFAVDTAGEAARASIAGGYALLRQLAPVILRSQGRGVMTAVLLDGDVPAVDLRLGTYALRARHDHTWEHAAGHDIGDARLWPRAGALIACTGPDEYVIAGSGVIVTFAAEGSSAGLLAVEEGRFDGDRFVAGRRLNGDETHQGRHVRLPSGAFGVQRVRLYRYR